MGSFTKWLYAILGAAITMGMVKFALDNPQEVVLDFWGYKTRPLAIWAVVLFSFIVGVLFCLPYILKEKWSRYRLRRQFAGKVEELTSELHALRTQPIESSSSEVNTKKDEMTDG